MKPPAFAYSRPETLAGALETLSEGVGTIIAGGQSLVPMLSLRVASPDALVDLSRLPSLRVTTNNPDSVILGAAITHAQIEDGLVPDPSRGMMPTVAHGIAYRAVRNFGTIGGAMALADPAADWPVCLIALDAMIITASLTGGRRIPASNFIQGPFATALQPDEILEAVEIPRLPEGARWGHVKLARKQGAYADSLAAVVLTAPGSMPKVILGATRDGVVRLDTVADALGRDSDLAGPALRECILAGVGPAEPENDPHRLRCHVAAITRAIERMRASACA